LLVYWSGRGAQITDALPNDAILLGVFSSASRPLPPETASRDGALVLFSLADGEVVAVSRPVRFKDSKN